MRFLFLLFAAVFIGTPAALGSCSLAYDLDAADRLRYEASGQPFGSGCVTPPVSDRIAYEYDDIDNITLVDYPSGTVDIATQYDNNSNPTSVTRGGVVQSYNYDALNLVREEKLVIDGRTYEFDYAYSKAGHLKTRARAGGPTLDLGPDGHGRPTRLRFGSTDYVSNVAYHPNGSPASGSFLNGQAFTQTLNDRQLPREITTQKPGGAAAVSLRYTYDMRGKVASLDDLAQPGHDRGFHYDANGRLVTANGSWGTATYKYDALSNIRDRDVGARNVDIAYNAATNRVSSVTDTANPARTFSHDARGNVTNDGRYAFTYDHADQPVSMTGSGVSATYVYDGNKRRVKSVVGGKTTYFVYSAVTGGLIYKDAVTDGKTTEYAAIGPASVRLETQSGTTTPVYTHADHLGSPVAATDASGNVLWREFYHPFGETLGYAAGANDDNTGFTGHVEDAG